MSIRAQQKLQTRQSIISAALNQLSSEKGFSSLSLREIAREAGIAPTSFYRHFKDMDELGLTLMDEVGQKLRSLMREGRESLKREEGGSIFRKSVHIYMNHLASNPHHFRLLLTEGSGSSPSFRNAIQRERDLFIEDLSQYMASHSAIKERSITELKLISEAIVVLVFNVSAQALELPKEEHSKITEKIIEQLKIISLGALAYKKS